MRTMQIYCLRWASDHPDGEVEYTVSTIAAMEGVLFICIDTITSGIQKTQDTPGSCNVALEKRE